MVQKLRLTLYKSKMLYWTPNGILERLFFSFFDSFFKRKEKLPKNWEQAVNKICHNRDFYKVDLSYLINHYSKKLLLTLLYTWPQLNKIWPLFFYMYANPNVLCNNSISELFYNIQTYTLPYDTKNHQIYCRTVISIRFLKGMKVKKMSLILILL